MQPEGGRSTPCEGGAVPTLRLGATLLYEAGLLATDDGATPSHKEAARGDAARSVVSGEVRYVIGKSLCSSRRGAAEES